MADTDTLTSTTRDEVVGVLQLHVSVVAATTETSPLLDHLSSTLIAGVRVSAVPLGVRAAAPFGSREAAPLGSRAADVVWVQRGDRDPARSRRAILAAAQSGALVVVTDAGLMDGAVTVPLTGPRFPLVSPDLGAIQELLRGLLGAIDEPDLPVLFGRAETSAVDVPGAEPVVESDAGAWCARVRMGRGEILWLGLFPELNDAGFRVERHVPLRAAACQLLVDETLAYAFRRKHGLAVRKLFGPYGAPMMAWQAHVEEVGGLRNRSMEHFLGRLANSRQAPTFSLIRRTYRWGERVPGLVYLPWTGDLPNEVRAQPDGTGFFSGQSIALADGSELSFAPSDRYVDFHARISDQPRVYPAPAPGGGLALGTPDGRIERFSVNFREGRVSLTRQGPILLSDGTVLEVPGASPTFGMTGEGPLLVVADEDGELRVYRRSGTGWEQTARYGTGSPVSPRLVDWTGSGTLDLILGTEDGSVDLCEDFERQGVSRRTTLFLTDRRRVTPWPIVSGSRRRVLCGDFLGRLWVREDGATRRLSGRDCTMAGSTEVHLQQDAVPVLVEVDGRTLLIVGASVVGRGQTLGDPGVPVTGELRDTLARLRKSRTPCNPHLFLFSGATLPEVADELARHRASFAALELPWDGMGANQHGWWIPRQDTALAFLLQRTSGLCFNFGWQSPATRGAPDSDVKYALAFPFLLRVGETRVDFALLTPALPDRYPRALELMTASGLPLTFFVHPEYRQQGAGAAEVDGWIGAVETLRRRHDAVFVTENQMAKAVAVTLASEVRVVREAGGSLRLEADTSGVPSWAGEWRAILSVAVEWPGHAPETLTSDGVSVVRGRRFVTSVDERTTVRIREEASVAPWRVTAANGPIAVDADGVEVLTPGFQELHLAGDGLQAEWPGAHVRETDTGLALTRFGEAGRVAIRVRPSGPPRAAVPWSPHDSRQDRWIMNRVFRGRTTPGYFVETGAADGVSTSASWALEHSFGWTGIAVEPNYLFFEQLRRNRRCHVANVAAAEFTGPLEFIQASWFGRIRQHFVGDRAERDHLADPYLKEDLDGTPAKVVKMPGMSLEDLLLSYGAPGQVDFVSIDAEFSEWFILRAFPFHRFRVLALCTRSKFPFEGGMKDSPHAEDIRQLLCGLGYLYDRELSRSVQYDFFVHPDVVTHPLPGPAVGSEGTG